MAEHIETDTLRAGISSIPEAAAASGAGQPKKAPQEKTGNAPPTLEPTGQNAGYRQGKHDGMVAGIKRGRTAGIKRGRTAGYASGYAAGVAAAQAAAPASKKQNKGN